VKRLRENKNLHSRRVYHAGGGGKAAATAESWRRRECALPAPPRDARVGGQGDGDAPQPRVATVPLGQDAVDSGKPFAPHLPIPIWILDVVAALADDAAIHPQSCAAHGVGWFTLLLFLLTHWEQSDLPPSFWRPHTRPSSRVVRVVFATAAANCSFGYAIRHVQENDSLGDSP